MREILFRGKLLSTNEWTEGNLAVSKTGVAIITPDDTPVGKYGQVDPDTVGQFTGILDKNGKKIFEGDVLAWSHFVMDHIARNQLVLVEFLDGEFAIRIIDDDKCYITAPLHREREYLTIVGDIYVLNVKLEDQNGTT